MPVLMIAIALLLGSAVGTADAIRRRVKLWITYAILWSMFYIGGHIFFAWYDPRFFSAYSIMWTLGFQTVTYIFIWLRGGWPVDALIGARIKGTGIAKDITHFLRFSYIVGNLIGLYFIYSPPSMSWRMFGIVLISFLNRVAFAKGFDWSLWLKITNLSLGFAVLGGFVISAYQALGVAKIVSDVLMERGTIFHHFSAGQGLILATLLIIAVVSSIAKSVLNK